MNIFVQRWWLWIEVLRETEYGSALRLVISRSPTSQIFEFRLFSCIFVISKLEQILPFWWKINFKNGKFISQNLEYYENPHQKIECVSLKHTVSELHPSSITTVDIVTFKCTQFGVGVQMERCGKF